MQQPGKGKINVVTLGCSKNLVDSEVLMNQLKMGGWEVVHDSNDTEAKVVIINTCGFIADAKEESVDTIMGFVDAKNKGIIDKVFVMGCLAQRYRNELQDEVPEVDGFFGVSELPAVLHALNTPVFSGCLTTRLLTTPGHYAYLKISEGCSWGCSYCAIPLIRGKHISRTVESLVEEVTILSEKGVKELILIAQDSTYYGMDIYGERRIAQLIDRLSQIKGIEWIRLHYAYPAHFPDDLIATIANNPKVCKYVDLPLQHISDRVLKAMHRGISRSETIALVEKLRQNIPGVAIRTTFLVGHPGEDQEDFDELMSFVDEFRLERVGVFTYSEEEGTYAQQYLADTIPPDEKERRASELMELQRNISFMINHSRVGSIIRVIVDSVEDEMIICRSEFDSPEVDQYVNIHLHGYSQNLKPGDFVNVKIVDADDYDLIGELC